MCSCQDIKEGLTGQKSKNSDEFLVQKKNPLILPPKFRDLPIPKNKQTNKNKTDLEKEDFDIEELLGSSSYEVIEEGIEKGSIEEGLLEEININKSTGNVHKFELHVDLNPDKMPILLRLVFHAYDVVHSRRIDQLFFVQIL